MVVGLLLFIVGEELGCWTATEMMMDAVGIAIARARTASMVCRLAAYLFRLFAGFDVW